MTIDPFVAGILVTLFAETAIIVLIVFAIALKSYTDSRKTHRNTSNSARSDKNE